MSYPNATQVAAFGSVVLVGRMTSFTGAGRRRSAVHAYPKRPGERIEDMGDASRRLEMSVALVGEDCATRAITLQNAVRDQPIALLVHPYAGEWWAFCEGTSDQIDFARAIDEIVIRLTFVETDPPDGSVPVATSVPSAQQGATAALIPLRIRFAGYLGRLAMAAGISREARMRIEQSLVTLDTAADPIETLLAAVRAVIPSTSLLARQLAALGLSQANFFGAINAYVDSTVEVFDGTASTPEPQTSTALLQTAADQLAEFEHQLWRSGAALWQSGAPQATHQAAEAAMDACYELAEAIALERPVPAPYTVPAVIDLITLAQQRYGSDAIARAMQIQRLNRLPNPLRIAAGTVLQLPA